MTRRPRLLSWLAALAAAPVLATAPALDEFAWQAPLDVPDAATAARLALPAAAFMASQSADLADLRIANGRGEPVAFALRRTPATTPDGRTARHPAYPLLREPASGKAGTAVDVRVNAPGGESVWVRMGGAAAPATTTAAELPAVLFDLRQEGARVRGLVLEGDLPANTPVRIAAATSADLAQWTPLPLRGSVYRFEGAAGFENRTLALDAPQSLQGRYLRLAWDAQPGVRITALSAVTGDAVPVRVSGALPPPRAVDGGLEWTLGFATRLAAISLSTPQANSLVPVRVLGRNEAAQPWRELARAAVYRVGAAGGESTNPAIGLGAALRQLRVEPALQGLPLPALAASAEFDAVEVVFLATGGGPYRLLAGRVATPAGDVPWATLAGAVPRPDELPAARAGPGQARVAPASPLPEWLPPVAPARLALWGVLLVGVLVLAFVAWRVLAQLRNAPASTND